MAKREVDRETFTREMGLRFKFPETLSEADQKAWREGKVYERVNFPTQVWQRFMAKAEQGTNHQQMLVTQCRDLMTKSGVPEDFRDVFLTGIQIDLGTGKMKATDIVVEVLGLINKYKKRD